MRLFANADYTFIEQRRKAYVVSGIVLLIGIGAMILNIVTTGSWLNYGVDFTGGSLVQVHFDDEVDVGQLRSVVSAISGSEVTRFAGENEYVIRVPLAEGVEVDAVRTEVQALLDEASLGAFEISRTELVGPKIGAELQQKAALAILFSFMLTLIYLAIRFELRFGLAAVIATVHDIMIALGFLAVFRVEIALPTVAAILTIVGYSLNDTIVVFDRIRENLGRKGARKLDQIALIDRSINETLPRTVLTSVTTLTVLMALLLVGPTTIRDFALVLILGVLIGTYSSIFVASPALVEIQKRMGEKKGRERRRRTEAPAV
jgi:preprotein translocase subunit SecF